MKSFKMIKETNLLKNYREKKKRGYRYETNKDTEEMYQRYELKCIRKYTSRKRSG